MKQHLQTVINLWYREWLMTHDPYEDDFDDLIREYIPEVPFTYDHLSVTYILL